MTIAAVRTFSIRALSRAALLAATLAAGLAGGLATPAIAQEKAVAPEKNPPGDIPDSQVFIAYAAPLGFALQVPEGWARTETADGVAFADKYGTIAVALKPHAGALTLASVRAEEAAELEKSGHAVKISKIEDVKLPAGPAVRIVYSSNSDPNPVTNKQLRLESERFYIARNDKVATLTFSAPAGADNADQWTLMSQSFKWK